MGQFDPVSLSRRGRRKVTVRTATFVYAGYMVYVVFRRRSMGGTRIFELGGSEGQGGGHAWG